jgi:outer membrane protein TolC
MKKLLLLGLVGCSLFANELDSYLSQSYKELFDTEVKKSLKQGDFNSLSWVSPLVLSYERSWNNQIEGSWSPKSVYSIGIDQPIFKSGGIFYGIIYANSNKNLATLSAKKERSKLSSSAVGLLFQIKQIKLSIAKLKLQVKNAKIEAKRAQELFGAGLVDSVVLDNAFVKIDEAQIALLNLESNLLTLKSEYKKIGNSSLKNAKLPKLRLLSKDEFLSRNADLKVAKAKAKSSKYYAKVIRSKYLPTISVGARYSKMSKAPTPRAKDAFTNYSLKVSMPLSVNVGNELEIAKLDSIIAAIKVKNSSIAQDVTYDAIVKRVRLIDKKIALARKEARGYGRILKSTKNLYRAGQKSIDDVRLLTNSLNIKRLDSKIYKIDKSLEILKLYERVE